MKKYLPIVLTSSAIFLFFFLLFSFTDSSKAATAAHIVISEVQIGTAEDAQDEFVELYNPTDNTIDLTAWRLTRTNQAGTDESNLVASLSGSMAPHSHVLIAHPEYNGTTTEDILYSATSNSITDNNTVTLYSDAGVTVVDQVGMGTATIFETATAPLPELGQSIERKANSASTTESMTSGTDVNSGNGEDTDNNVNDFIVREASQPQNSTSGTETPSSTSPTPTGEITPTITQTVTPTTSPTVTLTPTTTPTLTATPSILTPTPTDAPQIIFPKFQFVCTPKIITFKIFGQPFNFEFPTCKVVRVN